MSSGTGAPGSPEADADLRRRQRAASIFIGAAAHDLRTPLNTMAGWLQVLQTGQDLPAATRERAFKGLQSAVAQQAALADGLSQMAAINADETALEIGNTDVGEALAAALKTLQAEASAKLVDLDLDCAGAASVILVSDGAMAAALLRHCLAGALKLAAKNSRLAVGFSAREGQPGGCEVRIDLEKSLLPAPGIAAILQYTRGDDQTKPGGAGAAFAFAVAQGIAEFLGGSMRVDPLGEAMGEAGVRFVLRLPPRA